MIAWLSLAWACEPTLPAQLPPEVAARVEVVTPEGIEAAFEAEGYPAARVWYDASTCTWAVDPGRITDGLWFRGLGTLKRITLADNYDLGDGVLRQDRMDTNAERLQQRVGGEVTWQVVDGDDRYRNELGQQVPDQRVEVLVEGRSNGGIGLGLDSVQPYGIVTSLDYTHVGERGAQLQTGIGLGTPYHRWITEAEPTARWTFGAAFINWRGAAPVRPYAALQVELGNTNRPDLLLRQALVPRGRVDVGIEKGPGPLGTGFQVAGGIAFEVADTFDVVLDDAAMTKIRTDKLGRVFLTGRTSWQGDSPRRSDLAPWVQARAEVGVSDTPDLVVRAELEAQQSLRTGPLWWIARGRGLTRAGDLRFYDQEPVGGDYQRVFFNHRYWTNHAVQTELKLRAPIGQRLGLGLYTDASLFVDAKTQQPAMVGAAGPNLHVTLWVFGIDLYYGLGVEADGSLDHGAAIDLTTVY